MSGDLLRELSAIGLTMDQAAAVMDLMAKEKRQFVEAEEARKAQARDRVRKWREALGVPESEWLRLSESIKRRDNYTCVYCGESEGPIHCDHVVPLTQGGTNDPSNLVAACRACNCGKSGRTPEQWRACK